MTPYKCPVCNGNGAVSGPINLYGHVETHECHACSGTGIVWSSHEIVPIPACDPIGGFTWLDCFENYTSSTAYPMDEKIRIT